MSKFFDDLNPDQLAAASCLSHCLTIAAPGSGKTKMLAAKASHLLSMGKTVTAVTFTRDSALELRARIISQAGADVQQRLLVGTFHSIDLLMAFPERAKSAMGADILKHSRSNVGQPWVLVKEGFRRGAVARAYDLARPDDVKFEDATAVIEGLKSGQVKPKSVEETLLVNAYTEILDRHGVIDFQDILLKTNEALRTKTLTPLKTDHLLLDEFQDTDLPQLTWAFYHSSAGSVVTAVGDDDQSIYGFRRALGYEGMMRFESELRATRIVLGLNYRSHHEVLAPALALIDINLNRTPKALVSNKGLGGSSYWEKFQNRKLEAAACALLTKEAVALGQSVGILTRSNKRLDEIDAACAAAGIDYTRSAGDSVLHTREMSVMMAALGCMTRSNAKDVDEFLAWCQIDEFDLATLQKSYPKGVFSAIKSRADIGKSSVKDITKKTVVRLGKLFDQWKVFISTGGAEMAVYGVIDILIGFTDDKQSQRMLNVVAPIVIPQYVREPVGQPEPNHQTIFERCLENVRKAIAGQGSKNENQTAAVSLMTAHGSKGLEFDVVWIAGAEAETFPDKNSGVQEERRLFFVAMTRARKNLWVSASGSTEISQFISESALHRVPNGTFVTSEKL